MKYLAYSCPELECKELNGPLDSDVQFRNKCPFPVSKTILLGTHKDSESLRLSLRGFVTKEAEDLMRRREFVIAQKQVEIDLVAVSLDMLGLCAPRHSEIYPRARSFGLRPCPAEVGPQVLRQCSEIPYQQRLLRIAMRPLPPSSFGKNDRFSLIKEMGAVKLATYRGWDGDRFFNSSDELFLFWLPM